MRILHVAPVNVAGVPYSMMDMQRRFGHDARLVTLHRNTLDFPEDICLNLPLPRSMLASQWRRLKSRTSPLSRTQQPRGNPPIHRPRNAAEKLYFRLDDMLRRRAIERAIEQYRLDTFDIIHYDGGLDFYRDSRLAVSWKGQGKKIVCHYMGSDLRVRGIQPVMDRLSDLNLTNESDHLLLHPDIHYVYIPFDVSPYRVRPSENTRLRIVHSPSDRATKGTALILPVIRELQHVRDIEFVLVERKPHQEAISIKATCDIAIEQVGNLGGTGYGRNSLETLAMGIPTVTEMTADYLEWIPENPFVLARPETLLETLIRLVDDRALRAAKASAGRAWVEKYHSYESVHRRLMELYLEHGIAQ